ncbi:helix-turn-helix transcriptional regulator [Paenibacillus gansuensis]|uniref:Helix-turn-helix domain-containing protein n=1 Tax=Paenibacillus gansuensis TaxID=306542 RepID=A0ABW5PA77_9BACL
MNKDLLKEDRVHGDPVYPLSIYDISCPPEQPLLELHWHDELEFLLVTEGSAVFRVGIQDYEVDAGEAIFVNSGELHSGFITNGELCAFRAVVFHADLLGGRSADSLHELYMQPMLDRKFAPPVYLTRKAGGHAYVLDLLHELFELNTSRPPAFELATKGLLCLGMSRLLQLSSPPAADRSGSGSKTERLKRVLEYIESHYKEPIQLHQLASLLSVNESYFCRFFKSYTMKSPIEYINTYRVQQAALLLRGTGKSIMEIALDCGFANLSYFNLTFKDRFGCTPTAYRRAYTESQRG